MHDETKRSKKVKSWLAGFAEEPVRRVETPADFEHLCETVARGGPDGKPFKNREQFLNFIKLMAFSGARDKEALKLKWTDVDWKRQQLIIGSDRVKQKRKPTKPRFVPFNPKLEAHLKDMHSCKAPDSGWLFPSPHRIGSDEPVTDFNQTMQHVRDTAGFPEFEYVNLASYFTNYCRTLGLPTMTIASWTLDRYD